MHRLLAVFRVSTDGSHSVEITVDVNVDCKASEDGRCPVGDK